MNPQDTGKLLIGIGAAVMVLGIVVFLSGRAGLFKLPGDLHFEGKNWQVYFPVFSCILLSLILTLIFWLISIFRK